MSSDDYLEVNKAELIEFMRKAIHDIEEALIDNLERAFEEDQMALRVRAASQVRLLYELNTVFGGLLDDDDCRMIADLLANHLYY